MVHCHRMVLLFGVSDFMLGLSRLRGAKVALWSAAAVTLVSYVGLATVARHTHEIDQFAVIHFGATQPKNPWGSFSTWIIYFSPYCRIFEFALGCLFARIYVQVKTQAVSHKESRAGLIVPLLAICPIIVFNYLISHGSVHSQTLSVFHYSCGFAPLIAIIVFCCARYKNVLTRVLSAWPLVLCGEGGYSLYLLHLVIIKGIRWQPPQVLSSMSDLTDLVHASISIILGVALSLLSWRILEVPARRWLRSVLRTPMQMGQVAPVPLAADSERIDSTPQLERIR